MMLNTNAIMRMVLLINDFKEFVFVILAIEMLLNLCFRLTSYFDVMILLKFRVDNRNFCYQI